MSLYSIYKLLLYKIYLIPECLIDNKKKSFIVVYIVDTVSLNNSTKYLLFVFQNSVK